MDTTGFVLVGLKGSTWDMWYYLSDASHCLSPAFSEHHAGIGMNKLRILDETKATCSLIPSAKVVFIHRDD